ncbi:MAG: LysM peptidoglycan-binding domain-containing protein, partial [Arenimonas sp.]
MKNISLLTCSILVSITVLSACAQTTVSVRATSNENENTNREQIATVAQKRYPPISRHEPYKVQAGDTLYGISFRAGLSFLDVAAWNNIVEPYTLKIGQDIVLRPSNALIVTDVSTPSSSPASAAVMVAKPEANKPIEVTKPVVVTSTVIKPIKPLSVPVETAVAKPVLP